jgi:hypothetical protein
MLILLYALLAVWALQALLFVWCWFAYQHNRTAPPRT